jgi:hypothetical protein
MRDFTRLSLAEFEFPNEANMELAPHGIDYYKEKYAGFTLGSKYDSSIKNGKIYKYASFKSGTIKYIMDYGDSYYLGITLFDNQILHSINPSLKIRDIILKINDVIVENDGMMNVGQLLHLDEDYAPVDVIPMPPKVTMEIVRDEKKMTIAVDCDLPLTNGEVHIVGDLVFREASTNLHPLVNLYNLRLILILIYTENENYIPFIGNTYLYKVNGEILTKVSQLKKAKNMELMRDDQIILVSKK